MFLSKIERSQNTTAWSLFQWSDCMNQKFFLKVSKIGIKKLIEESKEKNHKTHPRVYQALLFVLAWSNNGSRRIGVTYTYGRCKGKLCYSKDLKNKMCGFMGIKHKQAVRYLNMLRNSMWIYKTNQYNLNGDLEYIISPSQYLMSEPDQKKYIFFKLNGKGRKGFDIFADLEKALNDDSHPAERNTDQYRFNIPDRTRRWRQKRHKNPDRVQRPRRKKTALFKTHCVNKSQKSIFPNRQKVTPIAVEAQDPFCRKDVRTTLAGKENYFGMLELKLTHCDTRIAEWHETQRLSQFQKIQCGLTTQCRAVWWKGKAFRWNATSECYERVKIKPKAKNTPPPIPYPERVTPERIMKDLGLTPAQYKERLRVMYPREYANLK